MIKNSPADTKDPGSIPGSGRSPGEGNGNPLQYSYLENPHGQRSLEGYIVHGVAKSQTQPTNKQQLIRRVPLAADCFLNHLLTIF